MDVFKELQKAMEQAARELEAQKQAQQQRPTAQQTVQRPAPAAGGPQAPDPYEARRPVEGPYGEPGHQRSYDEPASRTAYQEPRNEAAFREPGHDEAYVEPRHGERRKRKKSSQAACPRCGQGNPARAKFCSRCGGPMAEARPAAAPRPPVEAPAPVPAAPTPAAEEEAPRFVLKLDRDGVLQGLIFHEILGTPPGLRDDDW